MSIRQTAAFLFLGTVVSAFGAEKMTAPELIAMAQRAPNSAEFREALTTAFGDALPKGTAVSGQGPDFIWVIESPSSPLLFVDDQTVGAMSRAGESNLFYHVGQLKTGTSHSFYYLVDNQRVNGMTDLAAYTPDSYSQAGVPQGTLSDKLIHKSKIYDGMESEYWIYVPAQYKADTPAALMVWQDGAGHIQRDGVSRTLNVVDNLIAQKKIPVMIQVFISPGKVGVTAMRSVEYDTVSDKYARFLKDEILAEVQGKYNIRKDSYSRAITGSSSGGICAFNVAWFQPDQFSRVLSRIGSFTSIQWHPGEIDGGNVYPFKIRKEPKRNLRVWLQDGSEDLENVHGSWPLQNIEMANSLKFMKYDFHLSFGNGTHNGAHFNAEQPEALTWLWRDYDPTRTQQEYQMDPEERNKPFFRVKIYNR